MVTIATGRTVRAGWALLCGLAVTLLAACTTPVGANTTPTTTPAAAVALQVADGPVGAYLTDGAGRALYMWDNDRQGRSTCYGDCVADWPALTVDGPVTAGAGVDADLIALVQRTDGTDQVAYGGWPLYYFIDDVRPGQLSGQADPGFGAVWWLMSPTGKPLPSGPIVP